MSKSFIYLLLCILKPRINLRFNISAIFYVLLTMRIEWLHFPSIRGHILTLWIKIVSLKRWDTKLRSCNKYYNTEKDMKNRLLFFKSKNIFPTFFFHLSCSKWNKQPKWFFFRHFSVWALRLSVQDKSIYNRYNNKKSIIYLF